jgi:uncharacterized membrane protein YbhN (UPF0104 family)
MAKWWPPSAGFSRALRIAVVLTVAAACVGLVRRMDLHAMGVALLAASLPLVAAAAALNLVQVWQRSLALRAMLAPVHTASSWRLLRYTFAMYAGNNLFPGRAGELVRIYLLKTRENVPPSSTTAIALIEKLFDAVALLLLALPLPWLLPAMPRSVSAALLLLGAGGLVALTAMWLVARFGQHAEGRWGEFAHGAAVVRDPRLFAKTLGLLLSAHLTNAAMVALCMAAVGIHVAAAAPLLVLLGVAVLLAVPSTPSGIGALELGAVTALGLLGVANERALAFAVIYHMIQFVPVTLIGLGCYSWGSRKRAMKESLVLSDDQDVAR